jgi:hypothetical protein
MGAAKFFQRLFKLLKNDFCCRLESWREPIRSPVKTANFLSTFFIPDIIFAKGSGFCLALILHLPLPVAGLMSDGDCHSVGAAYQQLSERAKELGCGLQSPFMTLSFMALLVIPKLKISDKGMFDGEKVELL